MPSCHIALGSNLNNPAMQVKTALQSLSKLPNTALKKASKLYLTKPVGPQDQPDFINAVAHLSTSLSPQALLTHLQNIEKQQGRIHITHWGPRVIDLDILLYDDLKINEPNLTIPHPEMLNRDFVLIPLAEISPDCILPHGKLCSASNAVCHNEDII